MNILFVCTGNTCRSPMAEGMLREMAKQENLPLVVLSAGLRAFPTAPVSLESVEAVKTVMPSVDISEHRARTLSENFMEAADEVIAMTEDLKLKIKQVFPMHAGKVKTLAEVTGEGDNIKDPYGCGQSVYDDCAKQIYALLGKAVAYWK